MIEGGKEVYKGMDSLRDDTDPLRIPAAIFMMIRALLEITDKMAAANLRFCWPNLTALRHAQDRLRKKSKTPYFVIPDLIRNPVLFSSYVLSGYRLSPV